MNWITGLGGLTVLLALMGVVWLYFGRMRSTSFSQLGVDQLPAQRPIAFGPAAKTPDRIGSALRAWSSVQVQASPVAPEQSVAPEPAEESCPEPDYLPKPIPEWRATPEQTRAALGPGPAVERAEPQPKPAQIQQPATQARPIQAARPSEPRPVHEDVFNPLQEEPMSQEADYYEVLQISPNADPETIHRVYRIMASRFHPDNPSTGSLERFLELREAYQTLSDPSLRAEYDLSHEQRQAEPMPVFWQKAFVDGIEGETNRRLGVLSLLYHRRRINENKPGVSVMELERRMAFPREYLNFALWYLKAKGYIARMEENSDYAVTSAGIDFVESCAIQNQTIKDLLTTANGVDRKEDLPSAESAWNVRRMAPRLQRDSNPETALAPRTSAGGAD